MKNLGPPPAVPNNPAVESYLRQLYSAVSRLDARYYSQDQYVADPTGVSDAGKPIKTDASGNIVTSTTIYNAGDTRYIQIGTVGDHGDLTGLTDDDHTQYLNVTRHDTTTRHGSSVVDHGSIGGLTHDDHTHYYNQTRGDARYMRADNNPVNVLDVVYGADPTGITDSTTAIRLALATGRNVYLPEGDYWVSDRLVAVTAGQKIFGDGCGEIFTISSASWRTRILAKGTFFTQVMTHRQASTVASPVSDAAMSCVFDIENDAVSISDLMIDLYCDYTDTASTNLGSDCDIGIFVGCRKEVKIERVNVRGYFREASIYYDVTRGNFAEFSHTSVGDYPVSIGGHGCDRGLVHGCTVMGGRKGIYLSGPILTGGNYYDVASATDVADEGGRGGVGASDFTIDGQSYICSREHHSGYRAYDPTMDPDTEDIDAMSGCIVIDARRGDTDQGRVRRIRIDNIRMRTCEAARLFLGRAYEVEINWLHSEPDTSGVYDTSGNPITNNYATNAYGPIAAQTTSGALDGTDEVRIDGMWGTGPVAAWFQNRVTNYVILNCTTNADRFDNANFRGAVEFDGAVDFDSTVDFAGAVTFSGSGSIAASNIPLRYDYSSTNDIDDDTAVIIDLGGADFTGAGVLTTNSKARPQLMFAFRAASTNSFIQAIGTYVGTIGFYDDTVLEGTTGTDAQLNIGTSNSNPGKIYIENRLGSEVTVNLWIFT